MHVDFLCEVFEVTRSSYYAHRHRRRTPNVERLRMVGLPVPTPTDLCIGGADGTTLYITSARHSLQLEVLASAPDAGCLLQMQL